MCIVCVCVLQLNITSDKIVVETNTTHFSFNKQIFMTTHVTSKAQIYEYQIVTFYILNLHINACQIEN